MVEMGELELTEVQTNAMPRFKTLLADIYRLWSKTETYHMEDVRGVIEPHADAAIRTGKELEKLKQLK